MIIDKISDNLLNQISDLHTIPEGAYNIRKDGKLFGRQNDVDIEIISKPNKDGIDIFVKPNVKKKSVHIPVILTAGNFTDVVYNDFYIGEGAEVTIVAGCGIHNDTNKKSEHNGIHSFHLQKKCKVTYIEKHIATGNGEGEKNLNPVTSIEMEDGSFMEMQTYQLGGVSTSNRKTTANLGKNATLVINEKILTTDNQSAVTNFDVNLAENGAKVEVVSRAVAEDDSFQSFNSNITGNAKCFGHVECDGILSQNAIIESTPKLVAKNVNANLSHEAAIGKISEEQLIKLMTLGLTKKEAEKQILNGFLNN